jgi:carboxypeptidase C (cathepsin A)
LALRHKKQISVQIFETGTLRRGKKTTAKELKLDIRENFGRELPNINSTTSAQTHLNMILPIPKSIVSRIGSLFAILALFTSYPHHATSASISVKKPSDYTIKRTLLEKNYPAFASFNGSMHAGLMSTAPLDESTASDDDDYSEYFFWLFQPDATTKTADDNTPESFRDDTLIIWLNGGPGCSSMVGLMAENGPVTIPKFGPGIQAPNPSSAMNAPLIENPFAWTKKSAMLFVEQPGGTGFSTASSQWSGKQAEERTEDDVAESFWNFLQQFYNVFGKELSQKKLYITGESYAGFYIPSIARGIHLRNEKVLQIESSENSSSSSSVIEINLKGVAIGNGWIDVYIQGPTAIDFAFWHGMIDLREYRSLHQKWDECVSREITGMSNPPFHPFTTPDECGLSTAVMEASGSTFTYDVTTYDAYPGVLNKGGVIANFFNDADVRTALNVKSIEEQPLWLSCVPGSGRRRNLKGYSTHSHQNDQRDLILLQDDQPLSVVPYIAELLDDAKIDVLLYNGDLDLACSSQSTEMALESMEWSGREGWMNPDVTQWKEWIVDGNPSGHTKRYHNLEFVVVYNSGHFVPINQARNSLNLIGRLLDGKSFGDKENPQFTSTQREKKQMNNIASNENNRDALHFSVMTGAFGFFLGVLSSHIVSRRTASNRHHNNSSADSSPFPKTETTPLKHTTLVR